MGDRKSLLGRRIGATNIKTEYSADASARANITFIGSDDAILDFTSLLHEGSFDAVLGARKAIVKCVHCGQWALRFEACKHCGAPVD